MLEDFEDTHPADDERTTRRQPRRRMGWGKRLLTSLLALVLLLVIGVGSYAWFLSSKADDLDREDLLGTANPIGPADEKSDGTKLVSGKGTNYLLIGSDARPGETASRADVIQLVHVDAEHKGVWMIHFPRDLYVPIPGHGQDKVNASFAYGGAPLLVRTLQDLTGVKIDHVAQTDFEGFKGITDALGGVRVYAEEASSTGGNGGTKISQGYNELDGEQALGFVRERYQLSQGDISRGERQQAWLQGIMDKVVTPGVLLNPAKLSSVIDAGTKNTVVDNDLTSGKIRSEALKMRSIRSGDIHQLTAPWDGLGTTSGGASIVNLDEDGMSRLSKALRSDDMDEYTE